MRNQKLQTHSCYPICSVGYCAVTNLIEPSQGVDSPFEWVTALQNKGSLSKLTKLDIGLHTCAWHLTHLTLVMYICDPWTLPSNFPYIKAHFGTFWKIDPNVPLQAIWSKILNARPTMTSDLSLSHFGQKCSRFYYILRLSLWIIMVAFMYRSALRYRCDNIVHATGQRKLIDCLLLKPNINNTSTINPSLETDN